MQLLCLPLSGLEKEEGNREEEEMRRGEEWWARTVESGRSRGWHFVGLGAARGMLPQASGGQVRFCSGGLSECAHVRVKGYATLDMVVYFVAVAWSNSSCEGAHKSSKHGY